MSPPSAEPVRDLTEEARNLMRMMRGDDLVKAVDLGVWLFQPHAEEHLEAFLSDLVDRVASDKGAQ